MADKYIEITNLSEIEIDALHLMGASDKRDDNSKIGMFGSGNKYSIAWLVRNKVEFYIFSGMNHIKITTKQHQFREQSFNVICLNGVETSITDALGKDWIDEYIVRELVSNAIDETGFGYKIVDDIIPEVGFTKIYLDYSAFMNVNLDALFLFTREDVPIFKDESFSIHQARYNRIYRKGISVLEASNYIVAEKSIYDYNLDKCRINEERQSSMYDVAVEFRKHLNKIPPEIVYNILTSKNNFEQRLLYNMQYYLQNLNMSAFNGKILISESHVLLFGISANTIVLEPDIFKYVYNAFKDRKELRDKYNFSFVGSLNGNIAYKIDTTKDYLIDIINNKYNQLDLSESVEHRNVLLATLSQPDIEYFYDEGENAIIVNKDNKSDNDLIRLALCSKIIVGYQSSESSFSGKLASTVGLLVDKMLEKV